MSTAAYSQVPEPRLVAAQGLPDPLDPNNLGEPVWETWIAAGANTVISVYHQELSAGNDAALRIGYSIFDRTLQTPAWNEAGIIPEDPNGVGGLGDPSIVALDGDSDEFMACGLVRRPVGPYGQSAIGVARYASGEWESWSAFPETPFSTTAYRPYDKPWILAGGTYAGGRELYVTFWRASGDGRHSYLRSTDGGVSWTYGDITFGIGGDVVEAMAGNYQPAVAGDGPLYIACNSSPVCSGLSG